MNTSNSNKKRAIFSKHPIKNFVLGILVIIIFLLSQSIIAQVGIGNTDPKAQLDITATDITSPLNTDGILIPRVDNFPSTNPGTDQDGLLVFYTGSGFSGKGFYYWDSTSTSWIRVNTGNTDDGDWIVNSGNVERNSGNVLINTTDQNFKLSVSGESASGQNTSIDIGPNSINGNATEINRSYNTAGFGLRVNQNSGNINFNKAAISAFNTLGDFTTNLAYSTNPFASYGVYTRTLNPSVNTHGGYFEVGTSAVTVGSNQYGIRSVSHNNGNSGLIYGVKSEVYGNGNSEKYGFHTEIPVGSGGTHYGLYSDVQNSNGFAAYLVGRTELGVGISNRYRMPSSDGTLNQIMRTDGGGNLSFVDASSIFTNTDNQNISGSGLSGTDLTIGIQNGTNEVVDLSSLNTTNSLDQAYNQGGAGAGRIITANDGAVRINGEDGFLITGTFNSGNTIDTEITGAGTRLFFNPNKAAFRAGTVNGTQWDDANIGDYSAAFGRNNIVNGSTSAAFGFNNTVSSISSIVFGENNSASGAFNFITGTFNNTSGENSVAIGQSLSVDGNLSASFGSNNVVSTNNSFAIGDRLETFSSYETVFGTNNTSYSANSISGFDANDRLFVIGNGANATSRSNALTIYKSGLVNINDEYDMPLTAGTVNQVMAMIGSGQVDFVDASSIFTDTDNQTIDTFSFDTLTNELTLEIEDDGLTAQTVDLSSLSGNTLDQAYNQGGPGNGRIINATDGAFTITGVDGFSVLGTHGFGATISTGVQTKMFFNPRKSAFRAGRVASNQWNDVNVGDYSVAFGRDNTASGEASSVFGRDNITSGELSFSAGVFNDASGDVSMAFGNNTEASGSLAISMGQNTFARSYAEVVIGRFNNIYVPSGTTSWVSSDQVFTIGNGTSGNRSNALTIYKSGLMNINDEYNMPLTDGSANQVMTTDGSGNVSWQPNANGDITNVVAGTGLTGGGNTGAVTLNVVATNGLTANANDVQLGGTLTQDTNINYGTFDTRFNLNSSGDFIIQDNGTGIFQVDDNGNTNVGNNMQWRENSIAGTLIGQMLEDGNDGRFIIRENGSIAMDLRANTGYVFNEQGADRNFRVESDNQTNMLFVDAGNDAIGIGTNTPFGTFNIEANSSSTSPHLQITENNATDGGRINFNNTVETNNYWTLYGRSRDIAANSRFNLFHSSAGNVMIAKGDGDVGFQGTPNADLHVYHNNTASSDGFKIQNQGGNDNWWRMFTSNADGRLYLYSTLGGTSTRGNFNNNTGVYSATSDRRLKKDFKPLPFSWDNFMKLETLSYLYKSQKDDTRSLGLIAQDVKLIYPELVSYHKEDDIYHMNYSGFGVIAIKAVQELKQEVDALKAKNATLKAKLNKLEQLEARLSILESRGDYETVNSDKD